MGLIPEETLDAIRQKIDMAALVGERVQLVRSGKSAKGCCPFHKESTPSFIVNDERQTFHCFGCGESGDAFAFVMKADNLSFIEAVEKLAERAGVQLPAARISSPFDTDRLRIKEVLEFASNHYAALLKKDPAAEDARQYIVSRHLNAASVEEFKLGYSPRQDNLVSIALKKGYDEGILLKAGLAARRSDGRLRDYFFGRLMFPIRDVKGAVIGLGGRTMDDSGPKYLNSPESSVFSKGRVLYGLFEGVTVVRKERRACLMEGYMDVISAHQHGLKIACATLGTALTQEHVELIKRFVDKAIIVFDADKAGQSAAVRGAEMALAGGLDVRVASVPQGKDPDEFLHVHGYESFKAVLDGALDLVAFKTELLIKGVGELTSESKSSIAKDILRSIAQCPDEILKDEWVRRLATRLGVNEEALRRTGGKAIPQSGRVVGAAPARPKAPPRPRPNEMSPQELQLLGVMVKAPAVATEMEESFFDSASARLIFLKFREAAPYDGNWQDRFLRALPAWESSAVSRLLADDLRYDDPQTVLRGMIQRRTQK